MQSATIVTKVPQFDNNNLTLILLYSLIILGYNKILIKHKLVFLSLTLFL